MLKSLVAIASGVVILIAAGVADASKGKTRTVVDRFSGPYAFNIDCGDFGPYEFENLVAGHERIRVTDVFGDDGSLLQTVFHIQFDEIDTNSGTGFALPLKGAVHEVWDYASNTRTLNGAVFIGTTPGGGTYVQDTGRITMTLDTREAQFVAGPHEAFFGGGIDPVVCATLAAA